MKRIIEKLFSRKGMKRAEIFLGVLLILALLLQPCLAVLSPNYYAKTQVGRPLDSPGDSSLSDTLAYGDFLFLNDTTWTPGTVGETIVNWKWNLTNLSDPTDSAINNDQNATFGPFVADGNSYLLNLTVTASDDKQYSPTDVVYQVADNRVFVSANYSTVPAYDNRTLENPNGTITFWDESYSILDPMSYITEWWWQWTDLTTEKPNFSKLDHFTENMTNTTFKVNLTVKTSQGNLVSVSGITPIPPDIVYPIANFSVIPKSGVAPLEIGITDQALRMVNYTVSDVPLSYNYTIWNAADVNVFGTEFKTKNLNVTLPDSGVYHVIQNVTNSFGVSDEYTVRDIVVALPDGPIANFSASVREGLAPLNVTLIDQTTGVKPFTYKWIIGNGTWASQPKTDDNPQFNLTYSGKYWVNLTVTDKNGLTNFLNKTDFITVGPQKYPLAAFTAVPMNGTYPLNVSFIDQSVLDPDLLATGVPVKYHWTFDDGSEAFIKNPVHTFTSAKDYNVTLYVSHGDLPGSVQSTSKYLNVYEPSDSGINFTWVQEYGKTAYSAVLIPLGITADWTVNWIVEKDGVPYYPVDPLAFTPRFDLPETGVYNVTMTASRPDGYTTGSKIQQMEIFPNVPPSPEITMESPFDSGKYWAYAFAGDSIQFWSNTPNSMEDSWYWDFGDNSSSPLRSPVHSYNAPGLYTVTLKASNVKGETSADINQLPYVPYGVVDMYNVWILNDVVVIPSADPISGPMPLEVKFDAQVSINGKSDTESRKYIDKWYWDFDAYSMQGSSIEESPTYTYNEPGTFYPTVWVHLINDYYDYWRGAWPVDTITVSPNPLINCSFTEEEIDRIGTYGYSYKFMDTSKSYVSSIVSWDWDFGDGSPNSTEPAPTHLFKEPGIYTVTLTVEDGAFNSDTYSKSITVGAGSTGLSAGFTTDVDGGLAPLGVQFVDTSSGNPISYHWDFDDGMISTEKDPYHAFSSIGTYNVLLTITGNTGDSSQFSKDIRVVDKNIISRFIAEFPNYPNLHVVQFYDQSYAPAGITTWDWKFGDGGTANTKDPLYTYSGSGSFKPILTVSNGYGVIPVQRSFIYDFPPSFGGYIRFVR